MLLKNGYFIGKVYGVNQIINYELNVSLTNAKNEYTLIFNRLEVIDYWRREVNDRYEVVDRRITYKINEDNFPFDFNDKKEFIDLIDKHKIDFFKEIMDKQNEVIERDEVYIPIRTFDICTKKNLDEVLKMERVQKEFKLLNKEININNLVVIKAY